VAAGPIRRVLASPFTIVYGTRATSKVTDAYRRAAVAFANSWADAGGGMARIVSDDEFRALGADATRLHNLVTFGGVSSNALARTLAAAQPVGAIELADGEAPTARRLEGGFHVGECAFTAAGTGVVALGPVPHSDGRVVVSVAGSSLSGFGAAVELFQERLFETNSWQHRLPEYVVVGPGYVRRAQSAQRREVHNPLKDILAAGYWGAHWEFRSEAAFVKRGACRKEQ
jgi:hypothetical protein